MPEVLPPPPGRFDLNNETWDTPGGLPPDPARDAVDPNRAEPVMIIGPIPPELARAEPSNPLELRTTPASRLRWAIFALITAAAAVIMLARLLTGGGEPIDWGWLGAVLGLVLYAAYRVASSRDRKRPQ